MLVAVLQVAIVAGLLLWRPGAPPRPQPPNEDRSLFVGVRYRRESRRIPRPMVIHVATIDLHAPGVSLLVTPGDPGQKLPYRARTTGQFLTEVGAQLAINGDFFHPWHSTGWWDYYPHVGDPVVVEGTAISRGIDLTRGEKAKSHLSLYVTKDNRASFDRPLRTPYNAISGYPRLVHAGAALQPVEKHENLHPRTALGLDKARRHLILVVVDGRQNGYSEGVLLGELAEILVESGAHEAFNLDGGGSSTMAIMGPDGRSRLLNSTIDVRIPGRERPIANHLAIFARRLP